MLTARALGVLAVAAAFNTSAPANESTFVLNGSLNQSSSVLNGSSAETESSGDDWVVESSNDDYSWECKDFNNDDVDDGRYDNATCSDADSGLCDHFLTQCAWGAHFCTDKCAVSQGAVCAYHILSNLATYCAMVDELAANVTDAPAPFPTSGPTYRPAPTAAPSDFAPTHRPDPTLAPSAPTTAAPTYRPAPTTFADAHADDMDDSAHDDTVEGCDRHAYCSSCASSDECTAVVPKTEGMWHAHDAVMAVCHLPTLCDHYDAFPSRAPTSPRRDDDDDGHREAARADATAPFALAAAATRDGRARRAVPPEGDWAELAPALLVVAAAALAGVAVRRRATRRSWAFLGHDAVAPPPGSMYGAA